MTRPPARRPARRGDRSRRAEEPRVHRPPSTLPGDVVRELRATARKGRVEEAVRLLEEAVEALAADDPVRAERTAARVKDLAPRSPAAREVLGLALYLGERFRDALRELLAYRRLSGRADQNHLIADCHRALGAPAKAVAFAEEALKAPVHQEVRAEAAIVAGAALADQGRFEEALTLLHRVPTREDVGQPHDLRLWYVIGDVLERAGRPGQAADLFARVVRHDAEAFDAAERLAALGGPGAEP